MKSKNDTKKDFSAGSNTFLIVHGNTPKVRCLRCKQWCMQIELPDFVMYYCDSIFCTNVLELRRMKDGSWELHDYAAAVQALLDEQKAAELLELLIHPRPRFVPVIVK